MNDGKTTERIWDKFLTDRDKAVFKASGFGAKGGAWIFSAGRTSSRLRIVRAHPP
ncbi:MAG: hypothetical protein J0H80_10235 [Rhizobiales bacterium]|nr:hypothetical protein [Hyphomicrobiales bacterium]